MDQYSREFIAEKANGPAPDMFLMTWALQNRVVVSI